MDSFAQNYKEHLNMIHISASILASNIKNIERTLLDIKLAGVTSIHFDVMDGHYVNAISFGDKICREIVHMTDLPIYVHLMVNNPLKQAANFIDTGISGIAFHPVSSIRENQDLVNLISETGVQAGLAIANDDEMRMLQHIRNIDHVIAMTVPPGKCGQTLDQAMLSKVGNIKVICGKSVCIFVDGGVCNSTFYSCLNSGADAFIIGSYLFRGDITSNVNALKSIQNENRQYDYTS